MQKFEFKTQEEWLQQRRQGLGSSDLAPILGLPSFQGHTQHRVWRDKMGLSSPMQETPRMRLGRAMEGMIAEDFRKTHGVSFRRMSRYTILQDEKVPYLQVSPDRLISTQAQGLECKFSRQAEKWGDEGGDDIPENYLAQCVACLTVTGFDLWHVHALVNDDFKTYHIEASKALRDEIRTRVHDWWTKHIIKGEEPPVDGSEETLKYLGRPRNNLEPKLVVDQTSPLIFHILDLINAKKQLKEAKNSEAVLRAQVAQFIGSAAGVDFKAQDDGDTISGSISYGMVKGKTSWKDVAAHLAAQFKLTPTDLKQLGEKYRGPSNRSMRVSVEGQEDDDE
jgi:putative phage-type endonuclease